MDWSPSFCLERDEGDNFILNWSNSKLYQIEIFGTILMYDKGRSVLLMIMIGFSFKTSFAIIESINGFIKDSKEPPTPRLSEE